MAGASGGALAAQTSAAGAFGFIGAGYLTSSRLQQELSLARAQLHLSESDPLPVGVGYLAWQLEKDPAYAADVLNVALSNRVQAIWLAFGNNIGRWIEYVRSYDASSGRRPRTHIFVQISSVEEARTAIWDWEVDVLVAQGLFFFVLLPQPPLAWIRLSSHVHSPQQELNLAVMGIAPRHRFSL